MKIERGLRLVVVGLLAGFFSVNMTAHPPQEKVVKLYGSGQDVDSTAVYGIFHRNAPEDFQVQGVPSAALVGKNGNFMIGFGGYAKAVVGMDFGHPIPSPDEFITSHIPMGPTEGNGAKFNLSAQQSHLFLNFVALPGSDNEVGAFISANFLDNYVPMLQFAYLKYRGLQVGYDYSLFSDPACGGPAIDYEGPCSSTANPVAGLNYSVELGRNREWTLAAGVELPVVSFTTVEGESATVTQRVPDIPVAVQYAWNDGNSWTRLSAIFRDMAYRDLLTRRNHYKLGYGFQLSGAFTFLDKFTLYCQGVWGRGIGSMIQDTLDEGLDLTPSADRPGALETVMLWGAYATLQYDITDKWCCSATYSQVRTYSDFYEEGTTPRADLYRYAQYVSGNLFWHVSNCFDIGLEYLWGRRANYDGLKCADNRLQMGFQLSF